MAQPEETYPPNQKDQPLTAQISQYITQHREHISSVQLLAGLTYLTFFFGIAFLIILTYSFLSEAPPQGVYAFTLENYISFLADSFYRSILWESVFIGIQVTVLTLLIAYPVAYFLAFNESKYKNVYLLLVILPFWINIVIRTYAWQLVLGRQGVINYTLVDILGVIEQPIDMLYSQGAIVLGLVHVFLPFMLLPIYTSLDGLDRTEIEAAKNLGANKLQAFYEVTLPQTLPGIATGVAIVYVLAFGSFVVPLLLGGPQNVMIANIISDMFGHLQNWGVGSAMAVVVTGLSLALVYVFNRAVGIGDIYSGGETE